MVEINLMLCKSCIYENGEIDWKKFYVFQVLLCVNTESDWKNDCL